ncbi:hypothetical protein [Zoogloea sp.]|jgi:hypothetical protein|uniref:hypothetical protein n=1 Tax=Zoogloea sp. TaxID=49181 RepID=UPI0035B20926
MSQQPPRNLLQVLQQLDFDEAIEPSDPRFVDTDVARGATDLRSRLLTKFGLSLATGEFFPTLGRHVLLFGPIGCGKSTELMRLRAQLRDAGNPAGGKLYPILFNVRGEIDINNLEYADLFLSLAHAVMSELDRLQLRVDDAHIAGLKRWFSEHVLTQEAVKELAAQIGTEAEAGGGWPLLLKLTARFSAVFKNSSTYKDTMREVVRKTFTEFAVAFNHFIRAAEQAIQAAGKGQRLLLLVDGTDKIPLKQAQSLFLEDTEQLLGIQALVLYTAPITLKYVGTTHSKLNSELVLPIVKLASRDGQRFDPGWQAMHDLLDRRIDPAAFASPDLRDRLIEMSGGHPRELLRLLALACESAEGATIESATVDRAIELLAADYRYWLSPEDYTRLAEVDASNGLHVGNDERTRNLLWRLALLQYNDGSWRRSNPVVRELEGYRRAAQALAAPTP